MNVRGVLQLQPMVTLSRGALDEPADPADQRSALVEAIGELVGSATLPELVRCDRHHLACDRDGDRDNEVTPKVE